MDLKIIDTTEGFKALRADWNKFLQSSSANQIYLSWEWLFSWWDAFGDNTRKLHIVLLHQNNSLVAILPLVITQRNIKGLGTKAVLEFLGTGEDEKDEVCSNYMDFITSGSPDIFAEIEKYIQEGLKQNKWDFIYFKDVPGNSPTQGLFNKLSSPYKKEEQTPSYCATIQLPATWDDYMKTLSKSWRDQIKRGRKEMAGYGTVSSWSVKDKAHIAGAFDDFIKLHQAKWQHQGREGLFASGKFFKFHKSVTEFFADQNQISIHFLKINDRILASSILYHYNKVVYFYLPAYDPTFKTKIGLGLVERSFDIEESIQNGLQGYDFYKASENSYKWHLAKEKKEVRSISIVKTDLRYNVVGFLKQLKRQFSKKA